MPSYDDAQFLANSPDRLALLQSLSEEASSPGELAAEHSFSRRSAQRNLTEFVDRGWATSSGGTYHLTVTGGLIANEHAEYIGALSRINDFALFFRHLPNSDHAPDPAWLADAEMTTTTEDDPQAPVHQYVTSVKQLDTRRVRMLSPVLSRLFHEAHASLAFREVHTDLVMPTTMVERARERNPIEFKTVVTLDILSLYRSSEPFTVGLTISDNQLLMAAYDDEKQLQAVVESENPNFHAWALELFDRYRKQSERVTQ